MMKPVLRNGTTQDMCNEYPDPASCKSNPYCMYSEADATCKTCPFDGNTCYNARSDCCDHAVCEGATTSMDTKVCKACARVASQGACESDICNENANAVTYLWTGSECKACKSSGQDDCSSRCRGSFWDGQACQACGSCPTGQYRSACSGTNAGGCKADPRVFIGQSTVRKMCVTANVGVLCDADAGNRGKKANTDSADASDTFEITVSGAKSEQVCARRVDGVGWGQNLAIWCRPLHPEAANQVV